MTQEVLNLDFKSFHIVIFFKDIRSMDMILRQCCHDIVPKQMQHSGREDNKASFQYGQSLKIKNIT